MSSRCPSLFSLPDRLQALEWAIFLDVDGTIIDIASTPDSIVVPSELIRTLNSLVKQLNGAVALISGRLIDTLDTMFTPLRLPAAGVHGLFLRPTPDHPIIGPIENENLDSLRSSLLEFIHNYPECLLEDKSVSLAIHYRNAPYAEIPLRYHIDQLLSGYNSALIALSGKNVIEIKPANVTKGSAVKTLMRSPPFTGRIPVYFGDDRTDHDAFDVVNTMGGYTIYIGPYPQGTAQWTLPNPSAMRQWLSHLVCQLTQSEVKDELG